jgi:hypothetical protein
MLTAGSIIDLHMGDFCFDASQLGLNVSSGAIIVASQLFSELVVDSSFSF